MRMKRAALTLVVIVLLVLIRGSVFGQSVITVTTPEAGIVGGLAPQMEYLYGGKIGTTLALEPDGDLEVFTFDMASGNVLDQSDITSVVGPEIVGSSSTLGAAQTFGARSGRMAAFGPMRFKPAATKKGLSNGLSFSIFDLIGLRTFDSSGLIAVYGLDTIGVPARTQQVVMFSSDPLGHLSRLWEQSYPSPGGALPSETYPLVAFNSDGSGLYVQYSFFPANSTFFQSNIALLNAADGTTVGSVPVPHPTTITGLADDALSKRLIVLDLNTLLMIPEEPDQVAISKTVPVSDSLIPKGGLLSSLIGIADGRFAVTYGFTGLPVSRVSNAGDSIFFSTDLDSGLTTHGLAPDAAQVPYSSNITFDPAGGRVIVPYSLAATPSQFGNIGVPVIMQGGSRVSMRYP
jgi:hypothetical protein